MTVSFPNGDYTPFGYLRYPGHRASSWSSCEGGNLRTAADTVGMEWLYPWWRDPAAGAGLSLVGWVAGRRCPLRSDFAQMGYTSRYHSANVMGFDWSQDEVAVAARFFLVGDVLCLQITARNDAATERFTRLGVLGRAWTDGGVIETSLDATAARFVAGADSSGPAAHVLILDGWEPAAPAEAGLASPAEASAQASLTLAPGAEVVLLAALGRGESAAGSDAAARDALAQARGHLHGLVAEDAHFHARCPALVGDWPRGWREGLVYDFETTRMLVMPAGGIFADVWPTWMVAWPRVVLAEGVLDMLRLGYADAPLAQRAVLSLFRDAPAANVPCVFQDGSYNMVANDGSRCGTSPAWCLPFLSLELLYLRTLDLAWLNELYPYLARYLDWWLEHRTDGAGWVVYKCTWEAGEDGNPRLDPSGSGDRDITARIAPVELQAAMAQAADVLAFFAGELGARRDQRRWQGVRQAYRQRTRLLFDPTEGRFRDWLLQEGRFQEPAPDELYWGVDARRYSALSLTPLLGSATPEQQQALRREIRLHTAPPWTLWPSWCLTLVECAAAAGLHDVAGAITRAVLDRVYRETDRRSLGDGARPTPGVAPEYWPTDWHDFSASDAYGWGATTANLLLRHLFGLQESRETRRWRLDLAPALLGAPSELGKQYGVARYQYRGVVLRLTYRVEPDRLDADLELDAPHQCTVTTYGSAPATLYQSAGPAERHSFALRGARRYRLELDVPDRLSSPAP